MNSIQKSYAITAQAEGVGRSVPAALVAWNFFLTYLYDDQPNTRFTAVNATPSC